MGHVRDRFDADLRLASRSESTRKTYIGCVVLFVKFFMRSGQLPGPGPQPEPHPDPPCYPCMPPPGKHCELPDGDKEKCAAACHSRDLCVGVCSPQWDSTMNHGEGGCCYVHYECIECGQDPDDPGQFVPATY